MLRHVRRISFWNLFLDIWSDIRVWITPKTSPDSKFMLLYDFHYSSLVKHDDGDHHQPRCHDDMYENSFCPSSHRTGIVMIMVFLVSTRLQYIYSFLCHSPDAATIIRDERMEEAFVWVERWETYTVWTDTMRRGERNRKWGGEKRVDGNEGDMRVSVRISGGKNLSIFQNKKRTIIMMGMIMKKKCSKDSSSSSEREDWSSWSSRDCDLPLLQSSYTNRLKLMMITNSTHSLTDKRTKG